MFIEDGKIVIAEESELHGYWLKRFSDFMSWNDYRNGMLDCGVEIVKEVIVI